MNLNGKIGYKVINKKREEGTIIEVNDYFKVEFSSRIAQFPKDTFIKGFLTFKDEASQNEVAAAIEEAKAEEARHAKERRIAAEKTAEERKKPDEEETARKAGGKKKPVKIDDMFGKDYHVEHLRRHPFLTYQEVENQFGIKVSGFGRGINITSESVVLISSIGKKAGAFVYHDHWTEDGDYIYSGEGKSGDQKLTKGNLAIFNAAKDGKALYLFVKLSSSEYYFQGRVTCVEHFTENEKDENGIVRKEYKFRLKKIAEWTPFLVNR